MRAIWNFYVLISDHQVVYPKGQSDEFHGIGPDLDQLRGLKIRMYVYKVKYHHLQLTSQDTFTRFLCESGNTKTCETGTAKQYVNISIGKLLWLTVYHFSYRCFSPVRCNIYFWKIKSYCKNNFSIRTETWIAI